MSNLRVRNIHQDEISAYRRKVYKVINQNQNANYCSTHDDITAQVKISLPHNDFVIYDIQDILVPNKNALLFAITDRTEDIHSGNTPSHILEKTYDISHMEESDQLIIIVLNDHPRDFYAYEKPFLYDLKQCIIDMKIQETDIDIDQKKLDVLLTKYKEISNQKQPRSPKEAAGGIIIK